MATSGAYKNSAYTFNFSFTKASDPTAFFTGTFLTSEVKVVTRDGGTTNAAVNIASAPSHEGNGVYEINLTASEMNHDEIMIVLVPSSADVVPESISIVTEPTPSDILEVASSTVSGVADFKATGFSTFDYTTNQVIVATNNDKTGYSISGTLTTLDALDTQQDLQHSTTQSAISALNNFNPASDQVIVATNNDKTGYSISGTLTTLDALDTAQDSQHATTQSAIGALNDFDPSTEQVTVATNNDKTGYALSSAANDAIGAAFLAYTLTKGSPGTIERAFWQTLKTQALTDGEVSGTPGASAFDTNLTATTGAYDHLLLLFTSGALAGEARPIDTYVSTNGRITLQEALTAAPSSSDEFIIVPDHTDPISEIQSGLATSAALAVVDSNVDSILADTSTDGVVISTAQAQTLADEVLKRSVTNTQDSADAHSLASIVLAILESSRSSTTWTIRKTTGSTFTTKTLTLDSAAEPVTGVD